jgi:hypothetical protein
MGDTYANPADANNRRDEELIWPARQHPDELILPDAHPTRFPGTWVAIFEGTLPMDQVNGLEMGGFHLYKRVTACPNGNMQVIIRENRHPHRDGKVVHEATQERYKQYTHPARGGDDD